jgi:hypothetical protein
VAQRRWLPADTGGGVIVREFDPSIAANVVSDASGITSIKSTDGSLTASVTTGTKPQANTGVINNGPTVKFYVGGAGTLLKTPAFAQGPYWSNFVVAKQSENTGTQCVIDADNYNTGTGNRIGQYIRWDGTNVQSIAFTPAVDVAAPTVSQGVNLATKILAASLPSRTVQVSVDGGTLGTATLPGDPIGAQGQLTLGGWTANNQFFRGDGAIFYHNDGILSQADYDRFVGYLADRFNLQANLPANHPYKNGPPMIDTGTVVYFRRGIIIPS